jgi:cell division septation protein DedD
VTPSTKPVSASVPAAKPNVAKAAVPAVTGGPWLVEAGTYLNASALKAAEKKIRALGYEPQVTTTQKSVRMTRLRLGTFPESEVKEALAYARGIAPDAFVLRAGETFTVYAGTFTNPQNIRQMTQRLVSEGLPVEEEPIEVKRTISLVRFGGFADQATAAEVAGKARKAGIAAEVISPR